MKCALCFLLVISAVITASAQRSKSVLLPAPEAKKLASRCSRPSPRDFTDTWEPTTEQIKAMEAHLNDIKKLRVTSCCIEGSRVADPESWYLQYAGLIWRGKKIIYVSAVSTDPPVFKVIDGRTGATIADWKTMAVDVCDGGNTWGVVYDVETRKFSDLAVNGVA